MIKRFSLLAIIATVIILSIIPTQYYLVIPGQGLKLEEFITPEMKKFALWQIHEFYPMYYETVNEVYKKRFWVDMPFNPYYTPIKRSVMSSKEDDPMLQQKSTFGSVLNRSHKVRVKNTQPLEYVDGNDVLMVHIKQMEHFKAWCEPARELRSVWNRSEVQKAMEQFHGNSMRKVMNKFIDDLVRGGVDPILVSGFANKIRARFTKSVIGMNPVVFLKQLTSMPAFAMDMPMVEWIKYTVKFIHKNKYNKLIYKYLYPALYMIYQSAQNPAAS